MVDALIISFGGLFSSLNSMLIFVVLLPAVVSAGIGLYGIRSQLYGKPGYDIDDENRDQWGETGDRKVMWTNSS